MATLRRELGAIEFALTDLYAARPPTSLPASLEWLERRTEMSKGVLEALRQFGRYRGSENLMLSMGNGAGTIRPEFFLGHLLDTAAVHGANVTVSALASLLNRKSAKVSSKCLVWGVTVEERVRLAPGIDLSPLPDDPMPAVLQGEISRLPHHLQTKSSFAVLSKEFTVSPVVLEANDKDQMSHAGVHAFDQLRDVTDILCALGPSPVILEQHWDEFVDPKLAIISPMGGPSIFMQEVLPMLFAGPARIDGTAQRHVTRYLNLPDEVRKALAPPLNRMNAGMRRRSYSDQALDCGIALEMLLLQDPLNTEIGYRLALRAGLLLGRSLPERRRFKADVSALYGLRSKAAHGSMKPDKKGPAIAQAGFAACAAIVREIVRRGDFPEWPELELGAESPWSARPRKRRLA